MSPDRLSCSTRCGSGVCGGGSPSASSSARRPWRPSLGRLPSSRPSMHRRVGGALAVVARPRRRFVGHRRLTPTWAATLQAAPSARSTGSGSATASGSAGVRPRSLSRSRGQLARDLVDRRRGHDEDAEDGQQREQRDRDRGAAEQVGDGGRSDVADGSAGLAHRVEAAGVAVRSGQVVLDVDQAEHAEGDRRPADDRVARPAGPRSGGAAPSRLPSRSSSGAAYAAMPIEPSTALLIPADALPGQLPPLDGGDDDRGRDQAQAEAVAALLGVEIAGGGADMARQRPDHVRDPQPHGSEPAADSGHELGKRARPGPARRRPGAGALAPALLRRRASPGLAPRRAGSRACASRPRRGRRSGRHGCRGYATTPPVSPVTRPSHAHHQRLLHQPPPRELVAGGPLS